MSEVPLYASVRRQLGDLQRVPAGLQEVTVGLELSHLCARAEGKLRGSDLAHLLAGRDVPDVHLPNQPR